MKFVSSLLVLPFLVGVAVAETPDRAAFIPLPEQIVSPAESVSRAAPNQIDMRRISLAPAKVSEIDVNRDGKISFAELVLHDVVNGF